MSVESTRPRPTASRNTRGLLLGRIFGVPVYLNPSWLLLAAVIVLWYAPLAQNRVTDLSVTGAYALAVALVLGLFFSVLAHEAGHAFVARSRKIGVRAITIELLGGYTEMDSDGATPGADFMVSAVGPVVSAVLGGVAWSLMTVLPDASVMALLVGQLAWTNLVVAVFNALPGMPLDGGRALRAIVWAITRDRHIGTVVAGWIGRLVAIVTLAVGTVLVTSGVSIVSVIFLFLVAVNLWQGATVAIMQGRLGRRLPQVSLRQLMRPALAVESATPLAEALRRASERHGGVVIAIRDSSGTIIGLVDDQAAAAVPIERRPWVPVDSVARTLEPGRTLPVDLEGPGVLSAVQANPAPDYVVVHGDEVVGVLRTADLARLISG